MARVVVDVVLKPEILDPQGQAIVGALRRLGIDGVSDVRQGKHFELTVDDDIDDEIVRRLADTLLANPVIEDYTVTRQAGSPSADENTGDDVLHDPSAAALDGPDLGDR